MTALAIALAAWASPTAAAAQGPPLAPPVIAVEIAAEKVALDPDNGGQTRVGRLVFVGGLALSSRDERFGGWSDLWIDPAGGRLLAISDRGNFLDARLQRDENGAPLGVSEARLGPLIASDGRPLGGKWADAEALTRQRDGAFIVAFERQHRLMRYPPANPPLSRRPELLAMPAGLTRAPANGGLEAVAALHDGRLIAITEDMVDREARLGWVGDGHEWQRLSYVATNGFKPSGATLMPGGDLLVLERHFSPLDGLAARLVRVPRATIAAGARIEGEELGRLAPPLAVDNFEGVAAIRGGPGRVLVYLISDDNFSFLQRTLLLAFAFDG